MFAEQWKAISARIHGVLNAARLHAQLAVKSSDSYGSAKQLRDQLVSIRVILENFRDAFSASLPHSAVTTINGFTFGVGNLLGEDGNATQAIRQEQVWAALVMLAAFEAEMTFVLSDTQSAIRARAERAFQHLQRLIVVDAATQQQWKDALMGGEVECERHGAVHLLWHGIWAFKVSGAGERTDLVFQEPSDGSASAQGYAEGLVLTEWKIAQTNAEAKRQFVAARDQAKRYSQGVLAGIELTSFRFLVVVSPQHIDLPADASDGAVVYRHINIATSPLTPAKSRPRSENS